MIHQEEDGKILKTFIDIIGENNPVYTYEDVEAFLVFMDKYVLKMAGTREIQQYRKMNRDGNVMNKMTASDIAFAVVVYENGHDVWVEKMKEERMTTVEKANYKKTATLKYHTRMGTKHAVFRDGWTDEGREYYEQLKTIFERLKNGDMWKTVCLHWTTYLRKVGRNSYAGRLSGLVKFDTGSSDIDDGNNSDDGLEYEGEVDLPDDDFEVINPSSEIV